MPRAVILAAAAALLMYPIGAAAKRDPVAWSARVVDRSGSEFTVEARAAIERGWFMYGMRQPANGPSALRFSVDADEAVPMGPAVGYSVRTSYDAGFRMRVAKYTGTSLFHVPLRPRDGSIDSLSLIVRYQACNDQVCLPPQSTTLVVRVAPGAAR